MTPNKDGYLYWSPGQEKPRDEDICDVQIYVRVFHGWVDAEGWSGLTGTWVEIPRRYRLRTPAISPKDVRVGDMVTLKPLTVDSVENGVVWTTPVPGRQLFFPANMIATVTRPKPDPIGELEGVIADLESSQWTGAEVCAETLRRVAGMLNKEREG